MLKIKIILSSYWKKYQRIRILATVISKADSNLNPDNTKQLLAEKAIPQITALSRNGTLFSSRFRLYNAGMTVDMKQTI